jgi:molybdopterin/thiamine biosynthesis adenylyltransferase
MKVLIIGLGGIGTILSELISRFLNYKQDLEGSTLILIDGDKYEVKNYIRQSFNNLGNKAESKAADLKQKFQNITINSIPQFITKDTVNLITENDVVFMGVDNHKTRKLVSEYCKTLQNVILISGGNEYTDGSSQLYIRKEGQDLTPDLCAYHPEIRNAADKSPEELSCEELEISEPQLLFTNVTAAITMCWLFYNAVIEKDIKKSEVYFDILKMAVDSKQRVVK